MYMTCLPYISPTRLSVSLDVIFLKSGNKSDTGFLAIW